MSTQQHNEAGFNTVEINELTALVNNVTGAALDGARYAANNGQNPIKERS